MPIIFIAGASSGIGKVAARLFAEKGWEVIATMRRPEKEGELSDIANVHLLPLDVTDSAQIRETCQETLKAFDVDVLLNNAGYGIMAPLEKPTEAEIRRLFDTDVIGSMLVTQQFIPHFKKRRAGTIVVTTSLAAIIAFPRDAVYGAAKRAQQGMVESLYYEMRPFGVSVKAMVPGGTETNFQTPLNDTTGYEKMENMADSGKAILDHFLNHYACINVMRRMSVRCDCAGVEAEPPTARGLGIMAPNNILAIGQAACDLVFAAPDSKDVIERTDSRHGLRQLSAMREKKMGNPQYELITVE